MAGAPNHVRQGKQGSASHETRPWTCPSCKRTWNLLVEEPAVPQEKSRCPECGEPPSTFATGQVVRVREQNSARTRLGIIDEPVQAAVPVPGQTAVSDEGPYTGEFMVWHLSHGYGSAEPVEPEFELDVFRNLPLEAARRRGLAALLMTGVSVAPELIQPLTPDEERDLFGPREP